MQPGRQRGALPLIRRFNEHSVRLLNSALYVSHFDGDADSHGGTEVTFKRQNDDA